MIVMGMIEWCFRTLLNLEYLDGFWNNISFEWILIDNFETVVSILSITSSRISSNLEVLLVAIIDAVQTATLISRI